MECSLRYWKASVGLKDDFSIGPDSINHSSIHSWGSPSLGRIKVNIDGAIRIRDHLATCGGVARNHHYGRCMYRFMIHLGNVHVIFEELWVIFHGLKLALDRGQWSLMLSIW